MALRYTSSFNNTLGFSDADEQLHLTTGTVTSFTVPGTSTDMVILTFGCSSNSNIFVGYNETPAIPADDTATAFARVEFVTPDMQRYAIGGDVMSFITPDADAYLGVSIRSIPSMR